MRKGDGGEEVEVSLGEALQVLRASVGWTKAELADAAGVRPGALSQYEADKQVPELPSLLRVLGAMGYRLTELDTASDFLVLLKRARGLTREAREPLSSGPLAERVRAIAAQAGYPLPEDRARAVELWERLRKHTSQEVRRALVAEMEEFQVWSLCELVCWESAEAGAEDPVSALNLARLALEIADRVPGVESQRSRLRGYALFHLGNAQRVQGELRASGTAFAQAEEKWKAGEGCPGDLLSAARVLSLKASLRTTQRKLPEALDLLKQALAIGEPDMKGRLLIQKARVLEQQDDLDAAIATLKEAAPHVDQRRDPRLWLCLRQNMLLYLSMAGRHEEAESLLPEVRSLSEKLGKELDQIRFQWAEGRIAAGLGRTREGIEHLTKVRGEFVTRRIWYDAALVTMELAEILLGQGETALVKTLAVHLRPIFQAQGVHPEALAALTLVAKAAEQEKATAEMVRGVVTYLRKARHEPGLKFQGP